jgi:hypothetical protein
MTALSSALDNPDFYRAPGDMADPGKWAALFPPLPRDVASLAQTVQGLMLHQHMGSFYGQAPDARRQAQVHLRPLEAMLAEMQAIDARPLTLRREPDRRLIGNCRHFTLLFVAMLRAKGYAARSRCGFATYFDPGDFAVDHWVAEYWHETERRWVLADAQIDEVQREKFNVTINTLDLPRGAFLVAGEAWMQVREGRARADRFGIMDLSGHWFIAGNVIRDVAALNKMEMLPWDMWGAMPPFGEPVPEAKFALFDRLAAATRDPGTPLATLRALYAEARVPDEVFNSLRSQFETVRRREP